MATPADTIYHGGPIVTVDDAKPSAEAVAVRGGKIVAVGSRAEVMALKGSATTVVDLKGRTLVPGLIDGHAHVAQFGTRAIGANLLAAPDGAVETIDDLIAEMKKGVATQDQSLTGWVFGMGYDDAILGRHPTRDDLDKVSTTVPVTVIHISGHFSAVNSVGLKKIGYPAPTLLSWQSWDAVPDYIALLKSKAPQHPASIIVILNYLDSSPPPEGKAAATSYRAAMR